MRNLLVYLHIIANLILSAAVTPIVLYICHSIGKVVDWGQLEPAICGTLVLVTICYVLKETCEQQDYLEAVLRWNICKKRGIPFRM